jgi:murein tripeptide amidase MpaA
MNFLLWIILSSLVVSDVLSLPNASFTPSDHGLLSSIDDDEYIEGHRPVSYHGFKLLRFTPKTKEQLDLLTNFIDGNAMEGSGVDVWSQPSSPGRHVDLLVSPVKEQDINTFASEYGLNGTQEILMDDVENQIRSTSTSKIPDEAKTRARIRQKQMPQMNIANMSPTTFFSNFRRYNEINDFMQFLALNFPDLITLESIGSSFENRDMKIIQITSKVKKQGVDKPIFFMDGGLHAREWLSPATVLVVAYTLASQYHRNSDVRNILDTWDFRILPVANPDGYEYSHTTDRLWRKTRSRNGNSACRGVDPNRNFDYYWMHKGASSNPCSTIYAGPKAFSEPETRNMANFMMRHKRAIRIYTAIHSYSQMWLSPWGYDNSVPADSQNLLMKAKRAASALSRVYGTEYRVGPSSLTLYPAAGASDDFAKGRVGIPFSYTIELPPSSSANNGFLASPTLIRPTGLETTVGLIALAQEVSRDYT